MNNLSVMTTQHSLLRAACSCLVAIPGCQINSGRLGYQNGGGYDAVMSLPAGLPGDTTKLCDRCGSISYIGNG